MAKEDTRGQWGGVREAGPGKQLGRPSEPNAKKTLSLRVSPEIREYLDTLGNISESVAAIIERSKGFRDWIKSRREG